MSSAAHGSGSRAARPWLRPVVTVAAAFAAAAVVVVVAIASGPSSTTATGQTSALLTNPNLDPGTALHGAAPDFALTDQFGRSISLHGYAGRSSCTARR